MNGFEPFDVAKRVWEDQTQLTLGTGELPFPQYIDDERCEQDREPRAG